MKKLLKLLLLLLLNISVYFIYNSTKNSVYTITSLGDGVSVGINSYAIDDYSYADYYRDFKLKEKEKVKKKVKKKRKIEPCPNIYIIERLIQEH